jgi:succinoglycan biosynthesis transport protein ExoP
MNEQRALAVADAEKAYLAGPEKGLEYVYYPAEGMNSGPTLDLRAIWSALYRNRALILAVIALCLAGAIADAMLTEPIYQATTTVQIDQQTTKILRSEDTEPDTTSSDADRFLQTQLDVIRSRSLAERVAENLRLANDRGFISSMHISDGEDASPMKSKVITALQRDLSVDLPINSRVAKIMFSSPDPSLSAAVVNSFAQNYITSNLQRRFDTSAYSRQFLEGQLAQTKQKLEDSERQLIAYARSAGLIDASAGMPTVGTDTAPRSLTTFNLVQVNEAYAQSRAARVQAQQRWAAAAETPALNLPEVLANPTVQQLSQKKAELQAEYNEERQRRKEGHPAIIQAAAKIAEIDRQLNSIAESIKDSIRAQYIVAARQERGLQGSVGQLKGATLSEQDRSVRYNILRREADTNRQLYDTLLQRYRELSAAAGITTNNISIIDRAEVPTKPIWPRPLLNCLIGLLVGILVSALLVLLKEKADDSVRSPDDVERKLGVPLLGTTPLLKGKADPVGALEDPRSMLSEALYALRMSLELASDEGLPQSLLITSSREAEGKSTCSYAIARDLALSGKRVLLVDADLRKPSLHSIFAAENRVGLANVLARQKRLDEVVQRTAIENLSFVPSGPLPPNPAQLLTGKALDDVLARATELFDITVIDGPPVLGLADAPRLAAAVDGLVFVVEASRSHHGQAKAALKRLLGAKARILGVILSKFDARKAGYKGEYGYYYYGSATNAAALPEPEVA